MKVLKKLSIMLLTLMICFSIVPSNVNAESDDAVPNKTYSAYIRGKKSYTLSLKRAQKLVFTVTTSGNECYYDCFKLFNQRGEEIWYDELYQNDDVGKKTTTYTDYLSRGNYTLIFYADEDYNKGKLTWSYTAKNISKITQRTHNIYSRAPTCGFRKYYFDHFGSGNDKNIVKYNVPATGTYEFRVTAAVDGEIRYTIFNNSVDEVAYEEIDPNESIGKGYARNYYSLKKGTYYIVFKDPYYSWGIYKWMMRRIR